MYRLLIFSYKNQEFNFNSFCKTDCFFTFANEIIKQDEIICNYSSPRGRHSRMFRKGLDIV